MDELRIEHFKALKEEHRQYLLQVQQLWLYKISTLGVVIATAIFREKIISIDGIETKSLVAYGIAALPLLSLLIDLKALEVGLHVKLISQHIKENFGDVAEIRDWEAKLWSGTKLSLYRTWLTVITALGTSFAVLIIAFLFIYTIKPEWLMYLIIASVVSLLAVIVISARSLPKLLK
jgi:hypothetical protein